MLLFSNAPPLHISLCFLFDELGPSNPCLSGEGCWMCRDLESHHVCKTSSTRVEHNHQSALRRKRNKYDGALPLRKSLPPQRRRFRHISSVSLGGPRSAHLLPSIF